MTFTRLLVIQKCICSRGRIVYACLTPFRLEFA